VRAIATGARFHALSSLHNTVQYHQLCFLRVFQIFSLPHFPLWEILLPRDETGRFRRVGVGNMS